MHHVLLFVPNRHGPIHAEYGLYINAHNPELTMPKFRPVTFSRTPLATCTDFSTTIGLACESITLRPAQMKCQSWKTCLRVPGVVLQPRESGKLVGYVWQLMCRHCYTVVVWKHIELANAHLTASDVPIKTPPNAHVLFCISLFYLFCIFNVIA